MNKIIQSAVKTALAGAVMTAASSGAMAAGAVPLVDWDGGMMSNHIMHAGGSITATSSATSKNSYTDNPSLSHSAWGHAGRWFSFMTHETADTKITVTADVEGTLAPAFTVWASGSSEFDGGTPDFSEFGDNTGGNAPHDFNATGQLGAKGTNWMTAPSVPTNSDDPGQGNLLETLGYANSGATHHTGETDWDEHIHNGAYAAMGLTNTYTSGVSGSVAEGYAELDLADLAAGWYVIFVGGADNSLSGGGFDVNVSSVPIPAAAYLFGTALLGLAVTGRRKQKIT